METVEQSNSYISLSIAPNVSIIILNWNGKEDTIECLNSLVHVDYPNYNIILVDNASTDGLIEIVQAQFPQVILLRNQENSGFAEGNNIGIRYALSQQADYVLLLNNDTIIEPSFLKKLVNLGEEYSEVGMLSPLIYWYDSPETLWFYHGDINWKNGYASHKKNDMRQRIKNPAPYDADSMYLSGCALLIKTSVIKAIGELDKRFFCYYEDVDWCVRCKKAGWELAVVPSSAIKHKVSSSSTPAYGTFLSYRNIILFLWKHSTIPQFLVRVRRHIYRALSEYSWDKEKYYRSESVNPLDGIWAGLFGKYGKQCQKMPAWARTISYHSIRYLLWLFR